MVSWHRIQEMLREIGRDARLSGADRIPEELEKKLRARMAGEVNILEKRRKSQEVIPMFLRKKVTIPAAALAFVVAAIVLVLAFGTRPMPTLAQLVEASEAAATKVNSLRFKGRDPERGRMQDNEVLVKNPFLIRKDYADGSYFIITSDKYCNYDKAKNLFTIEPLDRAALEQKFGADTMATSIFTQMSIMGILKREANLAEEDIKIEEVAFKGKQAYKVTVSCEDWDGEAIFDKASGLLVKASVAGQEGEEGSLEVVEVNPELDDSLFSLEPPPGATVTDKTKEEGSGE